MGRLEVNAMDHRWSDMSEIIAEQEPLALHTTFGLGGPARWLAAPRSVEEAGRLVDRCREEDIRVYVLGLGANLLVCDDGVDGLVLRLNHHAFRQVEWPPLDGLRGSKVVVTAGAGADMHRFVLESVRRGLAGLEGLAGIPGTLGGIVRMNAGGRWGQIADVVREVTVVDEGGRSRRLTLEEVGFSYRSSRLGKAVVCEVKLELTMDDPAQVRRRFMDIWSQKSHVQPLGQPSAGCVFKNPPGHSAGRLIEQAGLKGHSIGGAHVSHVHANFIVAQEGATAGDVFALIGLIQSEVARRFAIELELEVKVWGRRHARSLESVA
ncbi:MAG TPA: UDP-N-acetylmuramate dehydrogenase [Phycisphaerae bacterium]|nr:UDP-N-acetylmuramate dehydrogenase [Phycisphaerae bacterium]